MKALFVLLCSATILLRTCEGQTDDNGGGDEEVFADDLCAPVPVGCFPMEPMSLCSKTCGVGLVTIHYFCEDGIRPMSGECCMGPCPSAMDRGSIQTQPDNSSHVIGLCRNTFPMCLGISYNQQPLEERKRQVGADCTGLAAVEPECRCQIYDNCVDCKDDDDCEWKISAKQCIEKSIWNMFGVVSGNEPCPCEECYDWATSPEESDSSWLTELNQQIRCPCRAVKKFWDFRLYPVDQPNDDWNRDWACMLYGAPWCSTYHPGAYGCMRSAGSTDTGARQQCCYSSTGDLLAPTHPGAGTPDKSNGTFEHPEVDVTPWKLCCAECEEEGSCNEYKQLRMGDNSHCL